MDQDWLNKHQEISLRRIKPRLQEHFARQIRLEPSHWESFEARLEEHWPRLFTILYELYRDRYDFFYHLEELALLMARSWLERSGALKELDERREQDPLWFQSEKVVGAVLYVDLFSDNLANLPRYIDYFKSLGLNYIHLMPLFAVPHGDNDGGYAVSSYRMVNPELGTMEELAEFARLLREEDISLVLDFVFNHTAHDHEWAQKAREGDPEFEEYYHIFPDRTMPDRYEEHLRDIFPEIRRGSFTWDNTMRKWVWTTFNSFQWDLNYANPQVFRAMAEEMLFLANNGVEILRLDAVAFIWKRMGTTCENQPEAHRIIQAFNAVASIAVPSMVFKSEAIVHPDEVIRYIDRDECQLSYNPQLMALLWEALATRETKLIEHAMRKRSRIPGDCTWVNYLRCHDDIGWTFDDDDAREVGIDPHGHRKFLNEFYTGHFKGSFARGVPFQFNPLTGDQRVSGTLASLAGLELAQQRNDPEQVEMAIRRILLLRCVTLSIGGIPLTYLGEEWGMLNDYSYISDLNKAKDSRWIHRPRIRWEDTEQWAMDSERVEKRIFSETARLHHLRKAMPALRNGGMEVIVTDNPHLFGYVRQQPEQRLLIVSNFSEQEQVFAENRLRIFGMSYRFLDHISGREIIANDDLKLDPYQCLWLESRD